MSCHLLYLLQITFFSFMVLRCMMLSASCYPCIKSSCLILSLRCYAAWPSLPRATRTDPSSFAASSQQHDITRLDMVSMILLCWAFTASFYAAWSSLPHVELLDVLIGLRYLTCPYGRYAAWPSHAELLNHPYPYVMLLDVFYITLFYFIRISWC